MSPMSHLSAARFKNAKFGHAEIKSVEPDGKDLVISGIASTGLVDRADEVVDQKSLEKAIDGFTTKTLFHQHNWQAPIGRVLDLVSTGSELLVKAVVGKNFDIPVIVQSLFGASVVMTSVNNVREQIKQGVVNAFSIGFTADKKEFKGEEDEEGPATLMVHELLELSVVTIPANKDCLFSMAKGYGAKDLTELYDINFQESGLWTADTGNSTITISNTTTNDLVLAKDTDASDGEDDEELIGGLQECLNRMRRS